MAVTINIKEDLRYQQGVIKNKIDTAKKMLQAGMDILQVQYFTALEMSQLEALAKELENFR